MLLHRSVYCEIVSLFICEFVCFGVDLNDSIIYFSFVGFLFDAHSLVDGK
jgi:hypothetical protein